MPLPPFSSRRRRRGRGQPSPGRPDQRLRLDLLRMPFSTPDAHTITIWTLVDLDDDETLFSSVASTEHVPQSVADCLRAFVLGSGADAVHLTLSPGKCDQLRPGAEPAAIVRAEIEATCMAIRELLSPTTSGQD